MALINAKKKILTDGTSIVVRSAVPEDATELLYLAKSVFSTSQYTLTEPAEFTVTELQERAWIESFTQPVGKILLLAEAEGLLIGMLDFQNGVKRRNSHTGILGMGVRDGWRGKGVGSFLMECLIEWAAANPLIERVELGVLDPNEAGLALYKKMGFQEEGRKIRGIKFSDGTYADEILMCREV